MKIKGSLREVLIHKT